MIVSSASVHMQIAQLQQAQPELQVIHSDDEMVQLHGGILVHRSFNDYTVRKIYTVDIIVPLDSDELPYVIDTGHHIEKSYPHRSEEGELCLATETEIRIRFIDGFDLAEWMTEYVEIYFFSYEYFERYGVFPFGERQHGCMGIIQTYQDLFETRDELSAYNIMVHITSHSYRGHHRCPCGSGQTIRNCHGSRMRLFYNDCRRNQILRNDIVLCQLEIDRYRKHASNN